MDTLTRTRDADGESRTSLPDALASPAPVALDGALAALLQASAEQLGAHWAVKSLQTGRYLCSSQGLGAQLGLALSDWAGRTDADIFDPLTAGLLRAADQTAQGQAGALASDHRLDVRGQRQDWQVLRVSCGSGSDRVIASLWQDLGTQRRRDAQLRVALEQLEQQQKANEALRKELADQGLRDAQTGLYSRAHFEDQLKREVDLSTREHREFALVYMQLDAFQETVLKAGEPAVQRILDAMGRLLRGNTRAMDASCRFDERRFGVLLSGVGLATAHARMEGLRRQCATQIVVLDGQDMGFTVSIGIASFPHTAHTEGEIQGACEVALSQAVARGGNTIAMASIRFDPN